MGRRGPAPTPAAIHRLRGTDRPGRTLDAVRPSAGAPACPCWLKGEAKDHWRRPAPVLSRVGVLTRLDADALARCCELRARWRRAETVIAEHGDTYTIRDGNGRAKCPAQLPQVAIAHKLALLLTRLEAEFGMTPSARSRLPAEPAESGIDELGRSLSEP